MDTRDHTFPSVIREMEADGKRFCSSVHGGSGWFPLAWERTRRKVDRQAGIARLGNEEELYRFTIYFRLATQYLLEHDDRPSAWKLLAIARSISLQFHANRKRASDPELLIDGEFVSRVAFAELTYHAMRLAKRYRIRLMLENVMVRVFWEQSPASGMPLLENAGHAQQ